MNFFFSFDGESFQSVGSSKYSHVMTYGMANYRENAFTMGCAFGYDCADKTEIMDMRTLTWFETLNYPFVYYGE